MLEDCTGAPDQHTQVRRETMLVTQVRIILKITNNGWKKLLEYWQLGKYATSINRPNVKFNEILTWYRLCGIADRHIAPRLRNAYCGTIMSNGNFGTILMKRIRPIFWKKQNKKTVRYRYKKTCWLLFKTGGRARDGFVRSTLGSDVRPKERTESRSNRITVSRRRTV